MESLEVVSNKHISMLALKFASLTPRASQGMWGSMANLYMCIMCISKVWPTYMVLFQIEGILFVLDILSPFLTAWDLSCISDEQSLLNFLAFLLRLVQLETTSFESCPNFQLIQNYRSCPEKLLVQRRGQIIPCNSWYAPSLPREQSQ